MHLQGAKLQNFRHTLRKEGADLVIVKNTLFRIAAGTLALEQVKFEVYKSWTKWRQIWKKAHCLLH